MDASRRQGGIQQLLAAEQEAQQIVNAARSGNFLIYFFSVVS
jgi:V-type H+-transporting ATPase subunit G